MKRELFGLLVISLLFLVTGCSGTPVSQPESTTAPAGISTSAPVEQATVASGTDMKTLVETTCTACHSFDRISSAHKTADQWKTTVDRMVGKGAQLTTDQATAVVAYLAATYP